MGQIKKNFPAACRRCKSIRKKLLCGVAVPCVCIKKLSCGVAARENINFED